MNSHLRTIFPSVFNAAEDTTNLGSVLAEIVDFMDIAIWKIDLSYRIVACNHKALQTYGDDIVGKHCHTVILKSTSVCSNCPVHAVVQSQRPSRIEQSHRDMAGNRLVVEQFTMPVPDEGRHGASGALVLIVDITHHKALERQLKRHHILLEKKARDKAAELAKSEGKFAVAFDASPDAININRLEDGLYVEINRGFTETTGYTAEDVIGKTSLDLELWADPADRQRLVKALRTKGFCRNLEARFRRKDGSLTTALMSARLITYKNTPHIVSLTRDISKLKEMERKIAEQKHLFETMFHAIDDGIVITDTERHIQLANMGMKNTFGYQPEELLGKSTAMLYADDQEFLLTGKEIFSAAGQTSAGNYIKRYRHKDGREFFGTTFGARLFDDKDKWIGNLGIMRDVTAQQQNENERDKLIAALQQTDEVVVITDLGGTIEFVNDAFTRITGYSKEEALGQNPRILQSGKHDRQFYENLWDTIVGGKTFKGRMVNKRKDGSLYTEEASISPVIASDGSIVNYVAVKRDISSKLALEQQLAQAQKMESIGRLTGGVAHDFNNLLSVIQGYTELALEKVIEPEELHGDLENILEAAERSAAIVRQLLAFSRQQTIAPKQIDLNGTVEEMLKMLRRLIGEEINLHWIPHSKKLPIKMDTSQMDQVLANLCVNAKDAIEGHGNITIETGSAVLDEHYCSEHAGFRPGKFATLAISDDGGGIDKKDLENVFEPFFTTKTLGQGTGLGLSTTYGIVKQNDGFINVYSELGQGTTLKIYLPFCNTVDHAQNTTGQQPEELGAGNEVILLVEDDAAIRNMVKTMLCKLGYSVLHAASPEKALEMAREAEKKIDLLLTDVVMPEMNGKELVCKLRQILPDLKCLYMSGYTVNVISQRGVLKDDVHFIQKPFSKNLLARRIREALYQ